jgi:hypothetical protein
MSNPEGCPTRQWLLARPRTWATRRVALRANALFGPAAQWVTCGSCHSGARCLDRERTKRAKATKRQACLSRLSCCFVAFVVQTLSCSNEPAYGNIGTKRPTGFLASGDRAPRELVGRGTPLPTPHPSEHHPLRFATGLPSVGGQRRTEGKPGTGRATCVGRWGTAWALLLLTEKTGRPVCHGRPAVMGSSLPGRPPRPGRASNWAKAPRLSSRRRTD